MQKDPHPAVRFIKFCLPVIIYAGFIFSVSSVPGKCLPDLFLYQDVLFHFIEYAIFGFLLSRAVKEYRVNDCLRKRLVLLAVVTLLYALSDESHQLFVSGRTASMADIAIDWIGSLIGGLLYR